MKEDDILDKVEEKVFEEEFETDKYGNSLLQIDISDDILYILFTDYMKRKEYSLVSRQHCEILNESNEDINKIISSTVINEIMYNVIKDELERKKEELGISNEELQEMIKSQEVEDE